MYVPLKQSLPPYVGFVRNLQTRKRELAEGASHCVLSGPTEVGKTTLLAATATLWGGPAVCVSSKDDLMDKVCERRWGPKQILDLRPDYSPLYPKAEVRSFDPTSLIRTPDQAVTMATTMMQMATVGMGSGVDQVSDAGIWEANSEAPLAAMLFAASPGNKRGIAPGSRDNKTGIEWVLHAVDNIIKPRPPKQDTKTNGQAALELPPRPIGPQPPGWYSAAEAVRDVPLFRNALRRTLDMDPRQRDSIALTMRKAVSPWTRLGLRGLNDPVFDDAFLDNPDATLFVLASPEGSIAGAAVTLLEHLVRVWRAKTARKEMRYRLLLALDEACNICPMPGLRRHVSEGRGLGCNLVVSVQSTSQFGTVFGTAYMNELRDTFPAALIMYGAAEMEMLQRGEIWSRETTRRESTVDQATGGRTLSPRLGSSLDYRRLLPENRGQARLLRRGQPGITTHLPDWPEFVQKYDQAVEEFRAQRNGGIGQSDESDPKSLYEWVMGRHRRAVQASRS
jgi:TraM recognition site of TraD and TraG